MEQQKQESWINNQVLIKYFNNELSYVELDKRNIQDVFELACESAFDLTGYGLNEWEFKRRSFENNILSEVYKFKQEDGSYYLLRTNTLITSTNSI